jgi:hypothetical protein
MPALFADGAKLASPFHGRVLRKTKLQRQEYTSKNRFMVADSIREEEPMRAAPARNFGGPLFSTRCQEELGCLVGFRSTRDATLADIYRFFKRFLIGKSN